MSAVAVGRVWYTIMQCACSCYVLRVEFVEVNESTFTPQSAEIVWMCGAIIAMDEWPLRLSGIRYGHARNDWFQTCSACRGVLLGKRLGASRTSFARCTDDIDVMHTNREIAADFLVPTDGKARRRWRRRNDVKQFPPGATHRDASVRAQLFSLADRVRAGPSGR